MNPRMVRAQLTVFGAIAVAICVYTAFNLLGIRFVNKPFHVMVHLPTGGGIFQGSAVTYRGVQVGRVGRVDLRTDEVTLTLSINHGSRIPANATANVYDLSAVGEQYIDLVPRSSDGPQLRAGDTIPAERTSTPLRTATVLYDLEQFVDSINAQDIAILGREGAAAFGGTGSALHSTITNLINLADQLTAAEPATLDLLRNSAVLLHGAAAHASDFDVFSNALRDLTTSLAKASPDISVLLRAGAADTTVFDQLITSTRPSLDVLLANTATLSGIQVARVPGLQALLVAVPEFGRKAPSIVHNGVLLGVADVDGTQRLCSTGVPLSSPISGSQTPVQHVSCPGFLSRGASNAPRPGESASNVWANELMDTDGHYAFGSYDPNTGLADNGANVPVQLGGTGGQSEYLGHDSWQAALLAVSGSQVG